MRIFASWKTAVVVLAVFVFTTVFLPCLSAQVMAADKAAPKAQTAQGTTVSDATTGVITEGPGGSSNTGAATGIIPDDGTTSGAAAEGAAAGLSTSTSISTGAIVGALMAISIAVAIALAASSDSGSTTSHH